MRCRHFASFLYVLSIQPHRILLHSCVDISEIYQEEASCKSPPYVCVFTDLKNYRCRVLWVQSPDYTWTFQFSISTLPCEPSPGSITCNTIYVQTTFSCTLERSMEKLRVQPIEEARQWMTRHNLLLNETKTEAVFIAAPNRKHLRDISCVNVCGYKLPHHRRSVTSGLPSTVA